MASARGYVLLVALSVIWGLGFVAIRRADYEIAAVNLTLLRWLLVSATFLVVYPFLVRQRAKFDRRDFPRLLFVALMNVVVYHLALNTAEKQVDASLAGLLASLGPLLTVLLSALVLHESVGGKLWGALGIAVAGSVVISLPDISLGTGAVEGPLLVVVSSVASASYAVASKPLTLKYGPMAISAWSALLGTAVMTPLLTPSLVAQAESLSAGGWGSVLYLALVSTAFANTVFFVLVSRQPLSKLGVQLYLVPLVSAAGGVLILGESLAVATVAGGALLLAAVALATSRR